AARRRASPPAPRSRWRARPSRRAGGRGGRAGRGSGRWRRSWRRGYEPAPRSAPTRCSRSRRAGRYIARVPLPPTLPPALVTAVPGPRSRALAARLARVESRNVTCLEPEPPIFWARAAGANVWDADGNRFVDLGAGF